MYMVDGIKLIRILKDPHLIDPTSLIDCYKELLDTLLNICKQFCERNGQSFSGTFGWTGNECLYGFWCMFGFQFIYCKLNYRFILQRYKSRNIHVSVTYQVRLWRSIVNIMSLLCLKWITFTFVLYQIRSGHIKLIYQIAVKPKIPYYIDYTYLHVWIPPVLSLLHNMEFSVDVQSLPWRTKYL